MFPGRLAFASNSRKEKGVLVAANTAGIHLLGVAEGPFAFATPFHWHHSVEQAYFSQACRTSAMRNIPAYDVPAHFDRHELSTQRRLSPTPSQLPITDRRLLLSASASNSRAQPPASASRYRYGAQFNLSGSWAPGTSALERRQPVFASEATAMGSGINAKCTAPLFSRWLLWRQERAYSRRSAQRDQ